MSMTAQAYAPRRRAAQLSPRREFRSMPTRTSQSAPFERALDRVSKKFDAQIADVQRRMDNIETRLAQGQHESAVEIQGMFGELRTVIGDTRDAVTDLGKRIGQIEVTDAVAAGVAAELKERNQHDATMERGALTARAWKPPSWPTVATVSGIGALVGILANAHSALVLAARVVKAVYDAVGR